jgi:peptidyl-dipeptidase Dcp
MAHIHLKPFEVSSLPFEAIPFQDINTEIFMPAVQEALIKARENLAKLKNETSAPTFENTCLAIETLSEDLEQVSTVYFNQLSSNTNDDLQKLANEIGPLLSQLNNDLILDETIFKRVESVYQNRHNNSHLKLTPEQIELLDAQYIEFVRNGAKLNAENKNILRDIDVEMAKLAPLYSDNVLKATNAFELHITNENELKGLPQSSIDTAGTEAKNRNKNGWIFTLHAPSYIPFMQYCDHRAHRETMYKAYLSRSFNDKFDNQKVILDILRLREQRAQLLGYSTHADFVLERRMAENKNTVFQFLKRIEVASLSAAQKEVQDVLNFAKDIGGPADFQAWDFSYYSEKLKEKLYQFSGEELRPYFPIDTVLKGVFKHAEKLYNLNFKENKQIPVYHEDVTAYEVYDQKKNSFIGLFYVDLLSRPSKKGGAWMTSYRGQGLYKGQVRRPHIAIVCNFSRPTDDTPSLLTFDEVNTLFHEFGHALHGLLSQCQYKSHSGTSVRWDFVELPSQIMENWLIEQESLDLVSGHYKTGEKLPLEMAKKIKASAKYLAGYVSLRQVTFGTLDMAWHTTPVKDIKNVRDFENQITSRLRVFPEVPNTNFSCAFSHIFAGGYSAGYYSYKWAEVLDADAFELFKQKGIFDPATAQSFRENILERGGTEHPMKLFTRFRGREPDPDALLRRDGLLG